MLVIRVDRKGGFWDISQNLKIERPEIERLKIFRFPDFSERLKIERLDFPDDAIISDLLKFGIPEILPSPKRKVRFH